MNIIHFGIDDDIINPCWDNVFKAVFTKDSPESRGALQELLSAIIGRNVAVSVITANEPPVDSIRERQIRYDITCKFDDGELCNIEMTLNPGTFEPLRLEYYSCKLFVGQDIRGSDKSYSDLKHTYQISLLVNDPIVNDDFFCHRFEYYDKEHNITLNGRTQIITIELSKLEKIASKPVDEMTALERWAVFFKYLQDIEKREIMNEIIKTEEGIAMAGQVLLTISKDEIERARLLSEYKFAVDLQSNMVEARREGRREGIEKGREEGIEKGKLIMNMLLSGESIESIIEKTGVNENEVRDFAALLGK